MTDPKANSVRHRRVWVTYHQDDPNGPLLSPEHSDECRDRATWCDACDCCEHCYHACPCTECGCSEYDPIEPKLHILED